MWFYLEKKSFMNTDTMCFKMIFPRKLFHTINTFELFWDTAFVCHVMFEASSPLRTRVVSTAIVWAVQGFDGFRNQNQTQTDINKNKNKQFITLATNKRFYKQFITFCVLFTFSP